MENETRQEILSKFIKSKQQELEDLRDASAKGELIPLGKIHDLENEIEKAENELAELDEIDGVYDAGSNFQNSLEIATKKW